MFDRFKRLMQSLLFGAVLVAILPLLALLALAVAFFDAEDVRGEQERPPY